MPNDATRVHTPHGDLTLEEIADLLPGAGELMQSVGTTWWKCAHAARAANWDLAAYFARRARGLLRKLAVARPKYAGDIALFETDHVTAVLTACERADIATFERAYEIAVRTANDLHARWGKPYLRWRLPEDPPADLDLTPDDRAR